MSRVPFTIAVDEYVCSTLDELRKMNDSRDYSGMSAALERIQRHVNAMENGLYESSDLINILLKSLESDEAKLSENTIDKIEKAYYKRYPDRKCETFTVLRDKGKKKKKK